MPSFKIEHFGIAVGLGIVLLSAACGSAGSGEPSGDPAGFVSDDPSGAGGPGYGAGGSGTGGGGGSGGSAGSGGAAGTGGDPEKAIEEADIIQLQNGRLYALSQYGGLTVIDASNADALSVLGRYTLEGTPFEMYVKSGVAYAMFSNWSSYVEWGGSWQYVQTSRLLVLDVNDPKNIVKLAEYELPGMISDSRIVGDVLYLVSHQDGYCYNCKAQPNTTVVSLDVSVPSQPAKVDELVFSGGQDQWSWKKSITVNENRMYVAGPEASSTEGGSTIQVVDISDPGGDLVLGAKVPAAGFIESRWQMDEYQGVLRVISQPPWGGSAPPTIQTFAVESAQQVTPLASVQMVLPVPESLRSVRFDGPRAYAITFQQTDPLFTIDLSDPANPKQVGELVMPGWVYHMEPRGDRVLGIGFDNTSPEGSLNVSLFDVSDMTAPKLVDRVNFGGDWGDFGEDQDRVHKAFRVIDELGLILVPYSAWSWSEGYYCGSSESGVQLVDFTDSDLTLRGLAPSLGRARRAFVEQARLFTVSDERVQTFDIADRDAPKKKSSLRLAQIVSQTRVVGDKVVRLSDDWWTDGWSLDVVPKDGVTLPDLGSSYDLTVMLGESTSCNVFGSAQLFAHDTHVYLVYGYADYYGYYGNSGARTIAAFDVASGVPVLLGKVTLPESNLPYGYGYWSPQYAVDGGTDVVQIGSTLIVHRHDVHQPDYDSTPTSYASFDVVDLKDPTKIGVTSIARPTALGHTSLSLVGPVVASSHWEAVAGQPGKVRFYLDRLDVSNPTAPKALPSINVPGSLLSVDDAAPGRAITVDYQREVEHGVSYQTCMDTWGYGAEFVPDDPYDYSSDYSQIIGTCSFMHRSYQLVDLHTGVSKPYATLLDSSAIADGHFVSDVAHGKDRTFVASACYYGCTSAAGHESQVEVVSGLSTGKLVRGSVALPEPLGYYTGAWLQTQATRAAFTLGWPSELYVLDATNASAPSLTSVHTFSSAISPYSIELVGDQAICSLGQYGVEIVELSP